MGLYITKRKKISIPNNTADKKYTHLNKCLLKSFIFIGFRIRNNLFIHVRTNIHECEMAFENGKQYLMPPKLIPYHLNVLHFLQADLCKHSLRIKAKQLSS